MSSVSSPPSRARILLFTSIAVVLLSAAALVLIFGRDSGGQPAPPTTTLTRDQQLARLRAEAVKAAEDYFPEQDRAQAAGDPNLLNGIFVPGSKLEAALKKEIIDRRAKGEVQETQSRTEQIEVLSLDEAKAEVRFVNVVLGGAVKDATTGKVKQTFRTGQRTWRLYLTRIGDRWLVQRLDTDESGTT